MVIFFFIFEKKIQLVSAEIKNGKIAKIFQQQGGGSSSPHPKDVGEADGADGYP